MIRKNDVLTGVVDSLGHNGEGIIHFDGTTVFVPFVLPQEKISFKVLKVKKSIAYGKVEQILSPSPFRVDARCGIFGKCGGCNYQHLSYSEQVENKAETVVNCFKKIAGLNAFVNEKFFSPLVYGYRNKMQLPVRLCKGQVKVGFFRENSHDIIDTNDCPLQPEWAKTVIKKVRELTQKTGLPAYDEELGSGLLRHVITREINGGFIFVFVFNYDTKKFDNELIAAFLPEFKNISIYVNVNGSKNNVILGENWRLLYGAGEINVCEFGIKYPVNAASFYQVNTPVKTALYERVLKRSDIDKSTVVIDAYSGAGVLTAMLADKAEKAYGIEIVNKAVEAADILKEKNGVENMFNICAPCEKALPELIKKTAAEGKKTVLVLDPPRSGVDVNTVSAIIENPPDKIIYISCSPQTLARDVGLIVGSLAVISGGAIEKRPDHTPRYAIDDVSVFDMFPQTKHVETLVCLSRKF